MSLRWPINYKVEVIFRPHNISLDDIMSFRSSVFCSCYDKKQILHKNLCGTGNEGSGIQFDSQVWEIVQCSTAVLLIRKQWWLFKNEISIFSFNLYILYFSNGYRATRTWIRMKLFESNHLIHWCFFWTKDAVGGKCWGAKGPMNRESLEALFHLVNIV